MDFFIYDRLARKIATLYQLCCDLLSKQPHYDFSMRAVKTVLIASHKLKLQQGFSTDVTFESEAGLIIRAITDANASKFTSEDDVLFGSILRDLFPDCELPKPERSEIVVAIKKEMETRGLEATTWYLGKVLQLYEAMQVHHGVMLVGDPFAGKTSSYQVNNN